MAVAVLILLLLCSLGWAEPSRVYLHRVRFEPHSVLQQQKEMARVVPGTAIDDASAKQAAASLRQDLKEGGYRDAQVEARLVPAGFRQADLVFHVLEGPMYRVQAVRFTGDLALRPAELKHALRPYHAPYSDATVQSDVARLQSFYAARGYFDAKVEPGPLHQEGADVTLSFSVKSGPHYTGFAAADTCRCLLDARRSSEREGVMEFQPRLQLEHAGAPASVSVTQQIDKGPPYTVDRIEFRGNHSTSEVTLRRALVLDEGAVLDWDRLRRSVGRLNEMGLFAPIGPEDVHILPDAARRRADIIIELHKGPRGRWALSGPAGPAAIGGPLEASIMSRLPAWGRGLLEGSTYYVSLSLFGWFSPMSRLFPWAPAKRLFPLIGLGRPYLPGQGWRSGIFLSPELGWKGTLAAYGAAQLHHGARALLKTESMAAPPLLVRIEWKNGTPAQTSALICEEPKSRWSKLRTIGAVASDFLLGAQPF